MNCITKLNEILNDRTMNLFDDIIEIDELIRSHRRTISIVVENDGRVIVRAPNHIPHNEVINFIRLKKNWIKAKQASAIERKKKIKRKMYISGEKFLYLGNEYPLQYITDYKNVFEFDGNKFIMNPNYKHQAADIFIKWYKLTAKKIISDKVNNFAGQFGFQHGSIRINSAQTRWGSCSSKRNLNFSYRLVLTPEFVIDYIVIHELAHTIEMNHSRKFWEIVRKLCPNYKVAEKWIKDNSYTLEL